MVSGWMKLSFKLLRQSFVVVVSLSPSHSHSLSLSLCGSMQTDREIFDMYISQRVTFATLLPSVNNIQ